MSSSCRTDIALHISDYFWNTINISPASQFVCQHSYGIFVYALPFYLNLFSVIALQVLSSWWKSLVIRHLNEKMRR